MIVSIINPIQATWIFSIILFAALAVTIKPRQITQWFPVSVTTELKGLSILMIVLSHIGYFLVSDTRFLWPLSIMAGVGVNLFLFLSGFGLTASQLKKDLSIGQFYRHRLLKLFIPFWLMMVTYLGLDFFIGKIYYSWDYILQAALGIFRHADLYQDFNSPLWYFTLILIYYFLFPLLFSKKRPWLSAIALYLAGYFLIFWSPTPLDYVIHLYKIHYVAFPLGVLAAWAVTKLKDTSLIEKWSRGWRSAIYYLVILALLGTFVYANVYSGVGVSPNLEQGMSIVAVVAIVAVFVLKKIESRLLYWFGLYSYEIYLWHWPIMYRYDIFYRFMPAGFEWLATALYLALFIGLGWLVSKIADFILRPGKK